MRHSEGTYRDEIIAKILFMCSKEKFGLMTDFAWYASVLLDLAVMQGKKWDGEKMIPSPASSFQLSISSFTISLFICDS